LKIPASLTFLLATLLFAHLAASTQAQTPFTMLISPNQAILGTNSGFSDVLTVSILAGEGFNGTVTLTLSGVPDGVTATLHDQAAFLTPLSVFTTSLQLTSSPSAKQGNYSLTLAATSQQSSNFYAVANTINLVIQEIGHPHATEITAAPGNNETLLVAFLAALLGSILGSAVTIMVTRRRKRSRRRGKTRR
jgi:hypothetical protein